MTPVSYQKSPLSCDITLTANEMQRSVQHTERTLYHIKRALYQKSPRSKEPHIERATYHKGPISEVPCKRSKQTFVLVAKLNPAPLNPFPSLLLFLVSCFWDYYSHQYHHWSHNRPWRATTVLVRGRVSSRVSAGLLALSRYAFIVRCLLSGFDGDWVGYSPPKKERNKERKTVRTVSWVLSN